MPFRRFRLNCNGYHDAGYGYQTTRAIRSLDRPDAKTIPILAMTANAFAEDRQKTYAAGMDEHLTKPLDTELLLKTIAKYTPEKKATMTP